MLTTKGHAQHYTKESIQKLAQTFVVRRKRLPFTHEWHRLYGLPTMDTVRRHWGSMQALYHVLVVPAAPPRKPTVTTHRRGRLKKWDEARVLASIQGFHRRTGRWPQTDDFAQDAFLPHPTVVQRLFGTLARARRQAGDPHGGFEGHGGKGRGGGAPLGPRFGRLRVLQGTGD